MPELRRDPLTGRWVILATGRGERPHQLGRRAGPGAPDGTADDCPFCPGHEAMTLPEVARRGPGRADAPGWQVRVVPNLFPIVEGATGERSGGDDLRRSRPAAGVHEVAVLSPAHHRSLAQLGDAQVAVILEVLQDRVRAHAAAGHVATQVIVNHGLAGGASLAHPHAQIVALDVMPPGVEQEVARVAVGDGCVLCRELARHQDDRSLDVVGGDAVLWCPWWSSTGYELLLAPRRHVARFEDAGEDIHAVAATLRQGLARLGERLGDPAYNVVVHTLPAGVPDDFHWHVHIRPRLQVDAGFELGTGILVNTVDPVEAAALLR